MESVSNYAGTAGFDHDLTLQFGLLSYNCKNEIEFLKKSGTLIEEIRKLDEYELEDIFFGNPPSRKKLNQTLDQILKNIHEVNKIPVNERHYD